MERKGNASAVVRHRTEIRKRAKLRVFLKNGIGFLLLNAKPWSDTSSLKISASESFFEGGRVSSNAQILGWTFGFYRNFGTFWRVLDSFSFILPK